MGEQILGAGISWTDYTFNPWWGCWKIADECKNCYADATDRRYGGEHWGRTAERRFFGDKHWREPLKWNAKAKRDGVRRRAFVGSMCDWAEVHANPDTNTLLEGTRRQLFKLIDACRNLDWLLLTKRPVDAANHLPWANGLTRIWPHVWLGVSCGARSSLPKIEILRHIPAAIHFVSCEPILEHITAADWDQAFGGGATFDGDAMTHCPFPIDWLIVGDESGPGARPAQPDWIRTAREAAIRHGVAFHFKQWAGREVGGITNPTPGERKGRKIHLPMLDGKQWAEFPTTE